MRPLRRRLVAATAALTTFVAVTAGPALGATAGVSDPTGVVASPNVSLVTTLPEPGAIGARFRDGIMYVTATTGVATYDVSDPAAPALLGRLPLPHFENEDVDLGGDILLVSNDASESTGILYIVDISDPTAPTLRSQLTMGGLAGVGGPGHTASCIAGCAFAWVTDGGAIRVIDLRDPDAPVDLGTFDTPAGVDPVLGPIATHDVQVDGNGLVWVVGYGGAAAYELPRRYDGNGLGRLVARTDSSGASTYGTELGAGDGAAPNDYILHNSLRRKGSDVLMVTEEDYNRPGCRGAGSFETWRMPKRTGTPAKPGELRVLDTWETELLADTAQPAVQCSAHYFDERNGIVAQAWYQQGVRFLDVSNPRDIRQVGYWVDPQSLDWAAYFPPTDPTGEIVYSLDFTHGIDVLTLDRPDAGGKAATVVAPVLPQWRSAAAAGGLLPSPAFQLVCPLPA